MRYLKAIISTILLVLVPMIMLPILQWYNKTFLEPNTDISWLYFLMFIISMIMIILSIANWISAVNNKDIKDL